MRQSIYYFQIFSAMDKWGYGCRDDIEDIRVSFPDGTATNILKTMIDLMCKEMTNEGYQNVEDVKEWLQTRCSLERLYLYLGLLNIPTQRPVDVDIKWRGQELRDFAKKQIKRQIEHQYGPGMKIRDEAQARLPESRGHIYVKNEVVNFLKEIGIEAYPEVIFYENALRDFYEWQRQERRKNPDADGLFGYGSVGFGNYKQKYGQQIRVDVAGWISGSYGRFGYPLIAVEIMKSSNLREEIAGLRKIHGLSAVYTVVIDALGQLNGELNGIPVVGLNVFKKGIVKRIEKVRDAINENRNFNEIFEIGRMFNGGRLD